MKPAVAAAVAQAAQNKNRAPGQRDQETSEPGQKWRADRPVTGSVWSLLLEHWRASVL